MQMKVDGAVLEPASSPLRTLLETLRDEFDVTSPKAGCETGSCGACTVLVDGSARRSCLTALYMVDGAEITTVEGLADGPELSAIQRAFRHHYASQCGFCTSGMVLAAGAYVEAGGSPDPADITDAIGGHICRCTGYVKIVDAIAAAARGDDFPDDVTATATNSTYVEIGGLG